MANVLDSIINIINSNIFSLTDYNKNYHDDNRANNMGRALEEYIKDSYSNTILSSNENDRLIQQSKVFDYTGNNTNPPDAMLKNGDAIEIKKIESPYSEISLNSSYPNHKLYKNSSMINKACKSIPGWTEKDILYVIGNVNKKSKNQHLRYLFMLYGFDYAADNEIYANLKQRLKNGISNIPNFDFSETKELGRLNNVDPLGITYLRLRGMWGIENPTKLFNKDIPNSFYNKKGFSHRFTLIFIVNNQKWDSFKNNSKFIELSNEIDNLTINDIKIRNPNNPVDLKNGKIVKYFIN